jgi:hypothetical protein
VKAVIVSGSQVQNTEMKAAGGLHSWKCRKMRKIPAKVKSSVADPDPGSGAFLTPGSGIRNRFFPDPGSRIPKQYFRELNDNVLHKKFYNSLKIGPNFFLQHFKHKIIFSFVKFVATKQGMTTIFFHPSLLLLFLDPGSEIRDG